MGRRGFGIIMLGKDKDVSVRVAEERELVM